MSSDRHACSKIRLYVLRSQLVDFGVDFPGQRAELVVAKQALKVVGALEVSLARH